MAKKKPLDGTAWSLRFVGPRPECAEENRISFARGKLTSADCTREGFHPSPYLPLSARKWQAFQTNDNGIFNAWHAERIGREKMTGTLTSSDVDSGESETYRWIAKPATE